VQVRVAVLGNIPTPAQRTDRFSGPNPGARGRRNIVLFEVAVLSEEAISMVDDDLPAVALLVRAPDHHYAVGRCEDGGTQRSNYVDAFMTTTPTAP
jgi:hypothetical protein